MQPPVQPAILSIKSHFCLISFLPSPLIDFAASNLTAILLCALNFEFLFLGPFSLWKTSGIASWFHLLSPRASQWVASHHLISLLSILIFHQSFTIINLSKIAHFQYLPADLVSQIEVAYFNTSSFSNLRFKYFNQFYFYLENLFTLLS